MSTITTIQSTDLISASRAVINTNISNLNTDKLEKSGGTMTGALAFSGATNSGVKLASLTTTERNALTPAEGMIIYNSTTSTVQVYQGSAWVNTYQALTRGTESFLGSAATGGDHRTFTLVSNTFSSANEIDVYRNGALMINGASADYETSGSDAIVFKYDVNDADVIALKIIKLI